MKISVRDICYKIIESRKKFVLISGNGGAGKTTLSFQLQDEFIKCNKVVKILSTDDFMLNKDYRKSVVKTYMCKISGEVKQCYLASVFPDAYDFKMLENVIDSSEADIIIIEGIGAIFLMNLFNSYKIFLQVCSETEYKRRVQRGRVGADLTIERQQIRTEQFENLILPLADSFDLKLTSENDVLEICEF